ncbi:transporter [Pontibacter sp. E15-1]|uniref:transporter n=1 Tax=Pontibacter sp. E15-1 TaxID=2919918 RepID=UPI001F4FEE4E|nr:transporter [Pontibacter sp. E15-1]MCJ8165925.1 transporter [Pontibacter sp. E15-1]
MRTYTDSISSRAAKSLLFLFLLLLAGQGYGQGTPEPEVSDISTNRPDLSQSAQVVPQGTVQVEVGVSYWKDTPDGTRVNAHTYPDVAVRIGLLKWLELQLEGAVQDSIVREAGSRRKVRGVGPWSAGVVASLWDEKGSLPAVALRGALTLPIGNDAFAPRHAEPEFTLAASKSITEQSEVLLNLGYSWEGGDPIPHLVLNLGTALSQTLSVYIETALDKPQGEGAAYLADSGILWRLRPNLQLDLAAGRQLNSLATDYFFTTGVSVRLPR